MFFLLLLSIIILFCRLNLVIISLITKKVNLNVELTRTIVYIMHNNGEELF